MISSQYYEDTYNEDDVAELCLACDIAPTDLNAFCKRLEGSAAIYRWESARFKDITSSKQTARELDTIGKQAARLLASLNDLSWDAETALHKQVDLDAQRMIAKGVAAKNGASLFLEIESDDQDFLGVLLDIPTLRGILGGIENAALSGAETLPKKRPGQIRNYGLRLWLANIRDIWLDVTEQPFSRDLTAEGDPITNAARFCVMAFQKIEPDCAPRTILNGMKAYIKEKSTSAGKVRAKTGP